MKNQKNNQTNSKNLDQDEIFYPIFSPFLTKERFAQSVGVSFDTVDGWVKRKYIPTVKVGVRRLINITALVNQLHQESYLK